MPKQAPSHATVVCIRGSLFGVHCLDLFFRKTLLFQNFVVMQLNFKAQYGVLGNIAISDKPRLQELP